MSARGNDSGARDVVHLGRGKDIAWEDGLSFAERSERFTAQNEIFDDIFHHGIQHVATVG